MTADLDTSTKEKHIQPIYQEVLVKTSEYAPTFEGFLSCTCPSVPFCCLTMCTHACPFASILSGCMHLVTRHLPRSKTEIADIWKLGRVRLAAAANQIWWTVLPSSILENLVVCRPSDTALFHGTASTSTDAKAQIWNACSSCINLPTGPGARAIVTSLVLYSRLIM